MKNFILMLFCSSVLIACQSRNTIQPPLIAADSLAGSIEVFSGKQVTLEGKIVHVCPVDQSKMKLLGTRHQVIKIVPLTKKDKFDPSWNGKQVRVQGTVSEIRFPRSYVDSIKQAGALLCHIDFTPCSDTAWVAAKHRQGVAEKITENYNTYLNDRMQKTGKDYISVVILTATKVEETEIKTEKIQTAQDKPDSDCTTCNGCPFCGLCFPKRS